MEDVGVHDRLDAGTLTIRERDAVDAAIDAGTDGSTTAPFFVDVADAAGLRHVQTAGFDCPLGCDAPMMTGGAAAADFDGDGRVDLFVTRLNAPDLLYRNVGDGTFEDVSAAAGFTEESPSNGVATADVDNDGDQDIFVSWLGDRHAFYENDGTGHFTENAAARGIIVEPLGFRQGMSVAFGDYDLDGWADAYVTEWRVMRTTPKPRSYSRLLRNLGRAAPGHFEDVSEAAGIEVDATPTDSFLGDGTYTFSPTFSDLDGDGLPDLAIVGDFGTSRLYWNEGDGTFIDGTHAAGVGTDATGMGSSIGDYDGDGRLDWFVTAIYDGDCEVTYGVCQIYDGNRLYRNEGARTFSDQTDSAGVRDGRWGWGTTFFDFDNDGDLDIVMTNGVTWEPAFFANPMRLWRNDGGQMVDVAARSGLTDTDDGRGLLVFDYDGDGDLDVYVANHHQRPRLYRNDRGNENGWLRVRLVGSESGRDAFGARIVARASEASTAMLREIRGGSNYLAQNERVAHFGLGPGDAPVKEVEIRWPSGAMQRLEDIPRNQTLLVMEPVVADAGSLAPDGAEAGR